MLMEVIMEVIDGDNDDGGGSEVNGSNKDVGFDNMNAGNGKNKVHFDVFSAVGDSNVLLIHSKVSSRYKFSFSAVKLMLRKKSKATQKKLLPDIIPLQEY